MKKRLVSIAFLFVVVCLCLSFGLAACKDDGNTAFKVTVKEGAGYTVKGINADGYKKDAEVAFEVEVTDEAKQIKEVSADGKALIANTDGSYKFTMPEKDVEISVELEGITPPPPTLILSETSIVLNTKSDETTATVTATVTPSADTHELEWKSGNENIATVTANGKTAAITAVGKGKTSISVSFKGLEVEAVEIAVSVVSVNPWTEAEETAMKEHLYGIVLYPTEVDEMEAKWEANPGQITISGGWVEGNGLAEYAEQYTAEEGWADVSDKYSSEVTSDAFMFEKAVETNDGTRYVRVFIYATEDETNLSQEGSFYIVAYDPYVYEWPADYLLAFLKSVLSAEAIPSVEAQHYYIGNYTVTAYYESTEADGGYGAILEEAGYTVEEKEGYYSAVSLDEMFTLAYAYEKGALQIEIRYNTTSDWPAKAVANAFDYYQSVNPTAFVLPEFEGDELTFKFADGIYNKYWINEGRERDMYGTITVSSSTQALADAYTQKLIDNGWVKVGNDGMYVKPIAESDQVNKITVTYTEKDGTVITIYYFSIKDPTKGWNDDAIKENNKFYKYTTDKLPEYTGDITAFSADKDTVYLSVPEADFDRLLEAYKQILLDAGFVLDGTSTWSQKYISPNKQYSLKPSVRTSQPNTIQIYFYEELPMAWSNERIKDTLQSYGSTLESIPMFESETNFLCKFSLYASDYMLKLTAKESGESLTQADLDAYMEKFLAEGWTQDANDSKKFIGSDGKTTITLSYATATGSISLEIKVNA